LSVELGGSSRDLPRFFSFANLWIFQIWNHTFYWNGLKHGGGGQPTGKLADAIDRDFGSFDKFKQQFTDTAVNHFGSGWAWLSQDPATGKLAISEGHDAQNPLTQGKIPILTCDVWGTALCIFTFAFPR